MDLDDDVEIDNLESLTDKEKEDFLRRQSPEFFIFKQDYEHYSNESKTKLKSIIEQCEDPKYDKFKESDLFKFIVAKNDLIQRYCINISFYMLLKTKGIKTKSHPIRSTLNLYRKLVKQTDDYLESMGLSDLNLIINKLKEDADLTQSNGDLTNINLNDHQKEDNKKSNNQTIVKKVKKKVKFEDEFGSDELPTSKRTKNKSMDKSVDKQPQTIDQQLKNSKKEEIEEVPDKEFYSDEEQDDKEVLFVHKRDDVKKRRISRMIEKNKVKIVLILF